MSTPISLRLADDALAALDAKAEAAGQSRGAYVLALLQAHVGSPAPAPVAGFTPQYPTKAERGEQIWHKGGLIAELQDLANKRGLSLDSMINGVVQLSKDRLPSPRPRPITSLPKVADQAAKR